MVGSYDYPGIEYVQSRMNERGLSLRKLKDFNIEMLAKESWKFMVESNPLISKFTKAHYYSNSDFSNASIDLNPSYF